MLVARYDVARASPAACRRARLRLRPSRGSRSSKPRAAAGFAARSRRPRPRPSTGATASCSTTPEISPDAGRTIPARHSTALFQRQLSGDRRAGVADRARPVVEQPARRRRAHRPAGAARRGGRAECTKRPECPGCAKWSKWSKRSRRSKRASRVGRVRQCARPAVERRDDEPVLRSAERRALAVRRRPVARNVHCATARPD